MNLTVSTAFIQITDPEPALAFYRDALGLEVRNDVENGGYRWITVGGAAQPDVSIVLSNYVDGSPEDAEGLAKLLAKGGLNGVHLSTDDLDGLFAALAAKDVEIVQEPADQPWGVRDGAVRDPSGNLVRINQR